MRKNAIGMYVIHKPSIRSKLLCNKQEDLTRIGLVELFVNFFRSAKAND